MVREKISRDFKSENVRQNLEAIKGYFEKNGATCYAKDALSYQYTYISKYHNKDFNILCCFDIRDENAEIKISADINEEDSIYEIDNLLDNLFADLMRILFGGKTKYVIRVYGKYYLRKALELNETFNWKNRINLISYEIPGRYQVYDIDKITSCPKEHVLYCDIEVSAYNLSSARSMAYNLFLEFTSLLSVLLDLGIEPFTTRENVLLLDYPIEGNLCNFNGSIGSNGIYDDELDILVFDNMNGLVAIDESGKMKLSTYINVGYSGNVVTQSSYNEVLENIFKDRDIKSYKKQYKKGKISKEITFYNSQLELVSEHSSFFRKIFRFENENSKEYMYFLNACQMYNFAHCACFMYPTAMISYFIASIEALSKTETTKVNLSESKSDMDRFVCFCKKYYTLIDNFDEKFYRYIYGKIRSGHFHSGESQFFEYNCNFDLSFEGDFFKMRDIYLRIRSELREIMINWINANIFNQYE